MHSHIPDLVKSIIYIKRGYKANPDFNIIYKTDNLDKIEFQHKIKVAKYKYCK